MGRARETAMPTAEKLRLPVKVLPWAYEMEEDSYSYYSDGKAKTLASVEPRSMLDAEWRNKTTEDFFQHPAVKEFAVEPGGFEAHYHLICDGLDAFLSDHGYQRTEDGFYLPTAPNDLHVGVFCHIAMLRVMMSHLLNIPFQYVNCPFVENYTGITVFSFQERPGQEGESIVPYLLSYGDVGHIYRDDEALPFVNYSTKKPY